MNRDIMCQANDVQGCDGSSPTALQTGDSGDAAKLNAFHFLRMGGVVKICTGCGSVESLPQIKARHPNAVSCCPERKMVQHRLFTADMLKEVRQSAVKLAAISGRQDEERSDERDQQAAPPA